MSSSWRKKMGFWRSVAMYYWKPFNQRRLRRFYRQFIQKGDLCFDIGAHLGNRVQAWRGLDARVVAVDPQPICLDFLNRKFGQDTSVTILNRAVGAQTGTTKMYLSHRAPTVSTLADHEWREALNARSRIRVDWEEEIEVQLTTLDALIEQYGLPKFCKIDVEDYESEVLKGLSHPIPVLSFEFFNWTPERTHECLELLEKLGDYTYNWSIGESQRWQSKTWLKATELTQEIGSRNAPESFSGDIYARLKNLAG